MRITGTSAFLPEVTKMMTAFGDSATPNPKTVRLVTHLVHAHLLDIISHVSPFASACSGGCATSGGTMSNNKRVMSVWDAVGGTGAQSAPERLVTADMIMHLFSKDAELTASVRRILEFKDHVRKAHEDIGSSSTAGPRQSGSSSAAGSAATGKLNPVTTSPQLLAQSGGAHIPATNVIAAAGSATSGHVGPASTGRASDILHVRKRTMPGEELSYLYTFSDEDEEDECCANLPLTTVLPPSKRRALAVADWMAESMSPAEYEDFETLRASALAFKRTKLFRDWLGLPNLIDEDALDVLSYLGWRRVGLLVQTALVVRRDATTNKSVRTEIRDLFVLGNGASQGVLTERYMAQPSMSFGLGLVQAPLLGKYSVGTDTSTKFAAQVPGSQVRQSIDPDYIREAQRRLDACAGSSSRRGTYRPFFA